MQTLLRPLKSVARAYLNRSAISQALIAIGACLLGGGLVGYLFADSACRQVQAAFVGCIGFWFLVAEYVTGDYPID